MRLALTFALATTVLSAGQPAPVRRDGADWVRTVNRTDPRPAAKLKVVAPSRLQVLGEERPDIAYTLTARVRGGSEAEARRLLDALQLRSQAFPGGRLLVVDEPSAPDVRVDLVVRVPRSLAALSARSQAGPLQVLDVEGDLWAETASGAMRLDRLGGNLEAHSGGGELTIGKVAGSIRALSNGGAIRVETVGGESSFESAGGEISVGKAAGPVYASTAGGGVSVGQAAASVTARTMGGVIDVRQAVGEVVAENSSGTILVGSARNVRCESGGGTIRLRNVSGTLRAATAVGNIVAELLPAVAMRDSLLSTAAGDITVLIPSNLAVTIRAQNEALGGVIVSDFPEVRMLPLGGAGARLLRAEGALNGGGPVLRVSASGTIYLRRQR